MGIDLWGLGAPGSRLPAAVTVRIPPIPRAQSHTSDLYPTDGKGRLGASGSHDSSPLLSDGSTQSLIRSIHTDLSSKIMIRVSFPQVRAVGHCGNYVFSTANGRGRYLAVRAFARVTVGGGEPERPPRPSRDPPSPAR